MSKRAKVYIWRSDRRYLNSKIIAIKVLPGSLPKVKLLYQSIDIFEGLFTAELWAVALYKSNWIYCTAWTINRVVVDPYTFNAVKRVWIDQNKKTYRSTNTSLTVQMYILAKIELLWNTHIHFNSFKAPKQHRKQCQKFCLPTQWYKTLWFQ